VPRATEGASGREIEFIVRNLLELKLQVEDLRRRIDTDRPIAADGWIGDLHPTPLAAPSAQVPTASSVPALEPPNQAPPPNVVTIAPGTKMADIERTAIEMALKETRGNRRRAAEMLGIGERTMYRKIKEYRMPEHLYQAHEVD
jgi:DNA-binding NtrC family response regulator